MFGLFNKKGGSRRNRASRKNKKSRRRRFRGGNSTAPMMGEKNMGLPNVASRR